MLPCPPRSPNFNIIENFWGKMSRRLYARGRQLETVEDTEEALFYEWGRLDTQYSRNLIKHLPNRGRECRSKFGIETSHWWIIGVNGTILFSSVKLSRVKMTIIRIHDGVTFIPVFLLVFVLWLMRACATFSFVLVLALVGHRLSHYTIGTEKHEMSAKFCHCI